LYRKQVRLLALLGIFLFCIFPAQALCAAVEWNVQRGAHFTGSPAIPGDGTVFAGSDDNRLYSFNADGNEQWQFEAGDDMGGPSVGTDADGNIRIYAGSAEGVIYALDKNGKQKWTYETGGSAIPAPALWVDSDDNRFVFAVSADNRLYKLKDEGDAVSLVWRFSTGDAISASPAINSDGIIFVGSGDGYLYAINTDGTQKWRYLTGDSIATSPAIDSDGTVYTGSDDGYLHAVDPDDGTSLWTFKTGDMVRSSPVIDRNGQIYFGSDDNRLYALNRSGVEQWSFLTGGNIRTAPVVASDGTIYSGSLDGYLYGISSDGEQDVKMQIKQAVSSPVISPDGILYIGTQTESGTTSSGRLYAVSTGTSGLANSAPWPASGHDVRRTGRNTVNKKPTADAGSDRDVVDGVSITLDASGSWDPDFGIVSWKWTQTGGDTTVTLSDADTAQAVFEAPSVDGDEDTLTFQVTVTDTGGLTDTDTVSIRVEEDDSFCFIRSARNVFSK